MKSPGEYLRAVCAAGIVLALSGCSHPLSDAHEPAENEPGVTFSAKNGLRIRPATANSLDLKLAEVEERPLAPVCQFTAQVYRTARAGQSGSGQTSDQASVLASGNVSPAEAAKLCVGQVVSARSGAAGAALPGRIVALKRTLEQATGPVEVLLALTDSSQPLAAGSFVSVTVSPGAGATALCVPRAALFRTTEGDFVYTVSGDHFVRAAVKLGGGDPEFAAVNDGLYAGDQVVVQPVLTLWLAELQSLRGGQACADGP